MGTFQGEDLLRNLEANYTYIFGDSFEWRRLPYINIGDYAVFQGDIILDKMDRVKKRKDFLKERIPEEIKSTNEIRTLRSHITTIGKKWPRNSIPYTVNSDVPNQNIIQDAVKHINSKTNIRIVKRTNQSNYIRIINGEINTSYVGMQGGPQDLTLAKFDKGTVIHELGHAIGLFHEHTKKDRDKYIYSLGEY